MKDIMVGFATHFFFMETERELISVLDEYFKSSKYKIIETVLRGEKGTKVLEIFIDGEDGVNIDELASINRELNEIVDRKFIINDISKLVLSSPGTDRAVKFIWQLKKHLGRDLEIEMNDGRKIEACLTEIEDGNDGKIFVEILHKEKGKTKTKETAVIDFKDIKTLKVKISFSKK